MGVLRNKLLRYGLHNVSYLIVNQQDSLSRHLYQELKRRAPKEIPVYQQNARQQDVWELLNGAKDDFLIYDRCGRLTFHIVLPYTFLQYPYIEAAIRVSYRKDICGNCSFYSTEAESLNGTWMNGTKLTESNGTVNIMTNVTANVPGGAAAAEPNTELEEGGKEAPLAEGSAAEVPKEHHHHTHSHGKRPQKQHRPHHHNDHHSTQGGH